MKVCKCSVALRGCIYWERVHRHGAAMKSKGKAARRRQGLEHRWDCGWCLKGCSSIETQFYLNTPATGWGVRGYLGLVTFREVIS